MSTVLIIGAGGVGGVTAHKCVQNNHVFSKIILASRTLSRCEAIQQQVGKENIEIAQLNADNTGEIIALPWRFCLILIYSR